MTVKSLATGLAALANTAAIGAAAAGVTWIAAVVPVAPEVQPVVFGVTQPAPASGWYPQDPAAEVPSPDQLTGVLNGLADPGVPFAGKAGLVEGGISPVEAHAADKRLRKAAQNGQLPLSFGVANIAPAGPGAATADVTVSGPRLAPRTMNVGFVDQDGWKLSRSSALTVLQLTSSG